MFICFDFNINIKFSDGFTFKFIPGLNLNGDYFYGFFWNFKESFTAELYPIENYSLLTSFTYLELGYEFFRFYGPVKFKFGITAIDYIDFNFYIDNYNPGYLDNYFENVFKISVFFKFFDIKPSIYFIINTYNDIYPYETVYNYFGFGLGLEYFYKWFLFTVEYIGLVDINSKEMILLNVVDFYFKFEFFY